MNEKSTGEGIVAVIREQDQYLMIQRAHDLRAGGYWCFVGGGVELGETQAEALVRECREEVGLEVEPVKKVYECLSFNKEWILHCWEARLLSHEICVNPREVADWSWMRPHEIAIMPKVLPSVVDLLVDCGAL